MKSSTKIFGAVAYELGGDDFEINFNGNTFSIDGNAEVAFEHTNYEAGFFHGLLQDCLTNGKAIELPSVKDFGGVGINDEEYMVVFEWDDGDAVAISDQEDINRSLRQVLDIPQEAK